MRAPLFAAVLLLAVSTPLLAAPVLTDEQMRTWFDTRQPPDPSDRQMADWLVSPAGYEWRRQEGILPRRRDGLPTSPERSVQGVTAQPQPETSNPGLTGTGEPRTLAERWRGRRQDHDVEPRPAPATVVPTMLPQQPSETPVQFRVRVQQENAALVDIVTNPPPGFTATPQLSPEAGSRAATKATGMVEGFEKAFKAADPDAGAMGGGGGEGAGAKPSGGGMGLKELGLAQMGGLGQPFKDMGLKVGDTGVTGPDGKPASSAQIDELQRRLAQEPLAQMARPDFHKVIPRDEYQRLKQQHRDRPELAGGPFKDVITTPGGRDFQWGRSCGKLAGDCNTNAAGGYSKGAFVAPEDLKKMASAAGAVPEKSKGRSAAEFWESLREEDAKYRRERAAGSKPPQDTRVGGGLGALLDRLMKSLGGGADDAGDEGGAAHSGEALVMDGELGGAAGGNAARSSAAGRESDLARMGRVPGVPGPAEKRGRRRAVLLLFMAGLALLLGFYVRRRLKEGSAP